MRVTFETHSTSTDNEEGIATGWHPGTLSPEGRVQAARLGRRRRDPSPDAVFTSDLARAVETATIAFEGEPTPILHDWRLRECDYGHLNGAPRELVHLQRPERLWDPYPGGESWAQAVQRVGWFLSDLARRTQDHHVVVIGHVATKWGLEHHLGNRRLEDLAAEEFVWQEGWDYEL